MSNHIKQEQLQEATECADGFLRAYHNKDENIGNYLRDKTPVDFNGYNGLLAEQFEYKIINVEEVDSKYKVSAKVTSVSMEEIFSNILNSYDESDSEEEIQQKVEDEMTNNKTTKKGYECEFYVVPDEYGYYVLVTEDLSNAMYGGFNDYFESLVEKQFEEAQ